MKNNKLEKNLERARINIYNILAILIVIIPEYFAELIYSFEASQHKIFCQTRETPGKTTLN